MPFNRTLATAFVSFRSVLLGRVRSIEGEINTIKEVLIGFNKRLDAFEDFVSRMPDGETAAIKAYLQSSLDIDLEQTTTDQADF